MVYLYSQNSVPFSPISAQPMANRFSARVEMLKVRIFLNPHSVIHNSSNTGQLEKSLWMESSLKNSINLSLGKLTKVGTLSTSLEHNFN